MAHTLAGSLNLTVILNEPIDWQYKGFPPTDRVVTVGTAGEQGWHALEGDLLFPILLLRESALQHNIDLMARYCRENGVSLAPHAKTPMSPQIVQRQLDAGAWGITAATVHQVGVFRAVGVPRILLANQLLETTALEWLAAELVRDPAFDFLYLVDSLEGVALADRVLVRINPARPLRVLVELGAPSGRSGIRDRAIAHAVARAVWSSPYLELAGVEAYEGAIHGSSLDDTLALVDRFLIDVREQTVELARAGLFQDREEIVVSAGGSLFFDRVVAHLAGSWDLGIPVRTVLRSGSYITHDFDVYERLSPLAGRGPQAASAVDRFRVALELWALVLSRPEPGLAIAGFGKRDAPYDNRLPVPFAVRRDGHTRSVASEIEVTALNDQHTFLRLDPNIDLAVGDLVGLNVAHPCTSFDKWRLVPLVDEDYRVSGAIRTYF
jgi:D-serine deaminase-like pyridoxal phosphate-dependent protein